MKKILLSLIIPSITIYSCDANSINQTVLTQSSLVNSSNVKESNSVSIDVSKNNEKGADISFSINSVNGFNTKATASGSGAKSAGDVQSYMIYLIKSASSTYPLNGDPVTNTVYGPYTVNKGSANIINFRNVPSSGGQYYYVGIRAFSGLNASGAELIKPNNGSGTAWTGSTASSNRFAVSSGNGVIVNADLTLSNYSTMSITTQLLDIVPATLDATITLTGLTSKVSSYKIGLCTDPAKPLTTTIASMPITVNRNTSQLSGSAHTVTFTNIPAGTYYATAQAYNAAGATGVSVVSIDNQGTAFTSPDNQKRVAVSSNAITVSASQILSPVANFQIPLKLEETTHMYNFNGNVNDESGNNTTGSAANMTLTTDRNGTANSAYSFNGSNSFLTIPNNPNVSYSNNFTISAWILPTTTHEIDTQGPEAGITVGTTGQKYVFAPNHGGDFDNAGVGISAGTNGVSVYEHASGYMPALLVWAGTVSGWTHITVVYNNLVPSLYINGAFVKTGIAGAKINVSPFILGNNFGAGGYVYGYFNGGIDDIKLYNRSLTAAEIAKVYNGQM